MSALDTFLDQIYIIEKIEYIDEGFTELIKTINPKNLVSKIQKTVKQKDAVGLKLLLKKLPKVEFQKLYTIANKINSKVSKAFEVIKKDISLKLKIKGRQLDFLSLLFAVFVVNEKNVTTTTQRYIHPLIDKMIAKLREHAGLITSGLLLLMASSLVILAVSPLSITPLLILVAVLCLSMMMLYIQIG